MTFEIVYERGNAKTLLSEKEAQARAKEGFVIQRRNCKIKGADLDRTLTQPCNLTIEVLPGKQEKNWKLNGFKLFLGGAKVDRIDVYGLCESMTFEAIAEQKKTNTQPEETPSDEPAPTAAPTGWW